MAACEDVFDAFLLESAGLGAKRAALLLQLPPSFAFETSIVCAFFEMVRARYDGLLACEPRHATWFAAAAGDDLRRFHVARVAADPARVPEAALPGGWAGFAYYRWHGSPRTYYSAYGAERVAEFAQLVTAAQRPAWCIFDNTTLGAATEDARTFVQRCAASRSSGTAQGNGQIR